MILGAFHLIAGYNQKSPTVLSQVSVTWCMYSSAWLIRNIIKAVFCVNVIPEMEHRELSFRATTPNPCTEFRVARNLSEGCGNHSNTGYCVPHNSACLPSVDESDWKCLCVNGYFTYNSTCVQAPQSLFENKDVSLGLFKTDRIVFINQDRMANSEHNFEFGEEVKEVDSDKGECVLKTLNPGFNCSVNSSGITVRITESLDSKLYTIIAYVTVLIGPEKADVDDTLAISFYVQTVRENQTIVLLDGTLKDTLVTTVDLTPNETDISLMGDANFFHIDSEGFVRTNWTISLDPNITSKRFSMYLWPSGDLYIDIVVYKPKYEMSITENSNGTVVCKTLSSGYNMILQSGDFIALQADGSVVVQKPFDYDTLVNKEYTFDIFSQYNERNFTTGVTLMIIDENDEKPSFSIIKYNFKAIMSEYETVVGVVSASDPDTVGNLSYSIEGQRGDSRFNVTQSGVVTMASAQESGDANITVSDGKFQDQASVHVVVIPVVNNDTHLQINFTCELFENKPVSTHVCNVNQSGYTDYIFDSADAQNIFNLDTNTGSITTNVVLDRETRSSYKYSIFAKDEKLSCKFASIQVQILVKDENDNPPFFKETYKGSVLENVEVGTKVELDQPISVGDKDEDPVFTFNITDGKFKINASSGEISTMGELDRETKDNYELTVGVFDGVHTTFTTVEIKVKDVNDNHPILPSVTFSVPENVSKDDEIGQLNATDADAGENKELSYTVDSEYFRVTSEGILKTDRKLDRETQALHVFNCTVFDNGNPRLSNTSRIEVILTDINEEPTVLNSGKLYNVPENSNCTVVPNMTYFFADGDLGKNSELNFTVLSSTGIFFIDSNGVLSCPVLDYEKSKKYYEVKIKAADNGDPSYSATTSIFIAVDDVNDNAPVASDDREFEVAFYSGECKTSNCSKLVALITATDDDSGVNGELIYQEIGGNASGFLSVDKDTGLVSSLTNVQSQPQNGTYHYIVEISDKGTPSLNSIITISLNVSVYEDTSLRIINIFPSENLRFNWTENVEIPSPFINLMTFTTNSTLSGVEFLTPNYILDDFYLINEFLYVNTTTLQRKQEHSRTSFDREKQRQYRFIIQAKLPQYSKLAELIIDILDVNDNPPQFIDKGLRVIIIKEDAKNGTRLNVNFAAVDPDEGENAKMSYKMPREDCDGLFQTTSDGSIFLIGQLDYENKEMRSCTLDITVYNINNEAMQSSVEVNIEVEDVNDNTPSFNSSVYQIFVNESNGTEDSQVDEVKVPGFSVSDLDDREFGIEGVRLSIKESCPLLVKEDKAENFILVVKQGISLDYETRKDYNCTLEAKDGGGLSSTSQLTIELLDINDNSPEADDVIQREVRRSTNVSHVIVNVINATDKDSGVNALLNFAFESTVGDYDYFKINSSNGQISIAKNLSALQLDHVELKVIISDSGQPALSTTVKVEVNITDDNVRPFFNQSEYNVIVEENTKISGLLVTVTALDMKKNETIICNCTYRLVPDSYSAPYTMPNGSGEIHVHSIPNPEYDREAQPTVSLTVIAEDEGGKQAQASVIITVLDKNDNDPKFLEDYPYQFEIYQEALVPTIIGEVRAEDKDVGDNAITRYQIADDASIISHFNESVIAINETTGALFSTASLDVGAVKDFTVNVTVEAIDVNAPDRTDRVLVIILVRYNDTNQNPPMFHVENSVLSKSVTMADFSSGVQIAVLNVTDADSGDDGQVSYNILNGNAFNMFQIDETGAISLQREVQFIGEHDINLTVQAIDKGVNPKTSTVTLSWKLQGQPPCTDPKTTTPGPTDTEKLFQTVTWSLIGVSCFLILTTAISVCGWCRSRLKAKNSSSGYGSNRESWGLKYNTGYGGFLPQQFSDDWKEEDVVLQKRIDEGIVVTYGASFTTGDAYFHYSTASNQSLSTWVQRIQMHERSGSSSFEVGTDRYPPNRPHTEFDQRKSFRLSLFDPRPPEPPPLPKPRDPGAPFIPKPDYD